MRNPFHNKSTLDQTVEGIEEAVEDPPRVLAAAGIIAGILIVSAIVSRSRNGEEGDSE